MAQFGEQAADEARKDAAGMLSKVQDKARDMGRNAVNAIDARREPLANGMASAAGSLHAGGDRASQMGQDATDKASRLAHGTADKLQAGADFVRDHDMKDMMSSVEKYVRQNPGRSLLLAGVVGFLAARAMRND